MQENVKDLYMSVNKAWPYNNKWYDYTQKKINSFIYQNTPKYIDDNSTYLNAGSGGTTYNLPGQCYHVDIARNLIENLPNFFVSSIENLPFQDNYFDATICVGSVLNYCDVFSAIKELSRTLKAGGCLILEYERSQTAELWFSKEYGLTTTIQKYTYLEHIHTLWLYSEKHIKQLLHDNSLQIKKFTRFHTLSAFVNNLCKDENKAGNFAKYDLLYKPLSYFMAHNIIILCQKL